jgi:hypothetical protein
VRIRLAAPLFLLLVLSGCGGRDRVAAPKPTAPADSTIALPAAPKPVSRPSPRSQLPGVARGLVPAESLASLEDADLKASECGIAPTFPCVQTFFTLRRHHQLGARIEYLGALAESKGWRVERVEHIRGGAYLDLVRDSLRARYALEKGLGPGPVGIVQLSVFGPPTELPSPSATEKARWSNEKRRYIEEANAICARAFAQLKSNPKDVAPALGKAARALTALEPPAGEGGEVASFVGPLRQLARAAHALALDHSENSLPLVVALGSFAKRFDKAASRYGLGECARLG